MKREELEKEFEEKWSLKTDYFNHRVGMFNEMKKWYADKILELSSKESEECPHNRTRELTGGTFCADCSKFLTPPQKQ